MAGCCRGASCERIFDERTARRSLQRYREKGLGALERRVVAVAAGGGLSGARVLEIGGGIGAVQAELLDAGAASGEVVELVGAYEPYARQLGAEKGLGDRTAYRVADLLDDPDAARPADVVVLNRVVCCSPDGIDLVRVAARLTRGTLVLTYPRHTVLWRLGVRLMNAGLWATRRSFRVFVHPPAALADAARSAGLEPTDRWRGRLWELAAFRLP